MTVIKADKAETIYHVWIYAGKPSGKVTVYDSTTKTRTNAGQADLDWLKERKIVGARVIVKLAVAPSPAFHSATPRR